MWTLFVILAACSDLKKENKLPVNENVVESASMKRYKSSWEEKEPRENEFFTSFEYYPIKGLGYEEGISRRDPSSIIKYGDKFYVFYTRSPKTPPPVGYDNATEKLPATTWDMCNIYFATSIDGVQWEEQGVVVSRGPQGEFDDRSVFTPDVMEYNGNFYLYYQAVKFPYRRRTRSGPG